MQQQHKNKNTQLFCLALILNFVNSLSFPHRLLQSQRELKKKTMAMKKLKPIMENQNPFDLLTEELIFIILDHLDSDPQDKKSFSLVCTSSHAIEARHRRSLTPLRTEFLPKLLHRYPDVSSLDLSLCTTVTDSALSHISDSYASSLKKVVFCRNGLFSHVGLERLALNCSHLVEVDISNGGELGDAGARAIAGASNLERLWLERCKNVTDIGIGCIAVGCRKLKVVSFKWCVGVGDLGVGLIAVKCKEIRNLNLSYLPITGKCLLSILKLPYIEELVLEGCFAIDDDSLVEIKHGCKSITTLDLSSCQSVSHRGLSSLMSGASCLQKLNLSHGSPVTPALADNLQKFSVLQSIMLDGCPVTSSVLKAIGNLKTSLIDLSLSKCPGVTDEGLSSLVMKHRDLRKLDITCCRKITYVSVSHITNSCSHLTSLKMESCSLVPREAFPLIGKLCQFLEELDLTDNEIDDEGLRFVSRCHRLSSLKLGICHDITDEGLAHIAAGCSKLMELDLYRCTGITDLGISAIAHGCTGLQMINVAYCKEITDHALKALSKCSRLSTLETRGCPQITSLGLAAVAAGCRQLTKIDIKKCHNIGDAGMIPLAHFLQNLRQINLSYTSVTDMGLLSLASIRCLQSLTILNVNNLTPSGLAAALLTCRGLTKVKLQPYFKSVLPQRLFELLEARGCTFQWRDKVLQAELDPKCWKLKLEDTDWGYI